MGETLLVGKMTGEMMGEMIPMTDMIPMGDMVPMGDTTITVIQENAVISEVSISVSGPNLAPNPTIPHSVIGYLMVTIMVAVPAVTQNAALHRKFSTEKSVAASVRKEPRKTPGDCVLQSKSFKHTYACNSTVARAFV